MDPELQRLQEQRKSLANQIQEHGKNQATWNGEDKAKWDTLNAAYDANLSALNSRREQVEREDAERRAVADRLTAVTNYQDYTPPANARIGRDGATLDTPIQNRRVFDAPEPDNYGIAVTAWMRNSVGVDLTDEEREAARKAKINLNAQQLTIDLLDTKRFNTMRDRVLLNGGIARFRNALSTQDGSTGGYTFGETFVARLELAMLAFGGIFQTSEIVRTPDAQPIRWPTANDTANTGRQIGENAAVTSTAQPSFNQVTWGAFKFTSDEILVPFELLQTNQVGLETKIPDMLGERLGRIQNTKYTVGTGGTTPWGIVQRATAGVTTAAAGAIAWDELMDLEHSVDPSRRAMGCGWMFHDNIKLGLRKLKDGNGRSLWQPGDNAAAPDTLLTYPYTINQDMASTIEASAITILFGQLFAHKIRQVGSIRFYRLTERHRENDQDAFLAFAQGDSNTLDAGDGPIRKLTQHA